MTPAEIGLASREMLEAEVTELQKRIGLARDAMEAASRAFPPGDTRAHFLRLQQIVDARLTGKKLPTLTLKTGQETWA